MLVYCRVVPGVRTPHGRRASEQFDHRFADVAGHGKLGARMDKAVSGTKTHCMHCFVRECAIPILPYIATHRVNSDPADIVTRRSGCTDLVEGRMVSLGQFLSTFHANTTYKMRARREVFMSCRHKTDNLYSLYAGTNHHLVRAFGTCPFETCHEVDSYFSAVFAYLPYCTAKKKHYYRQ